MEEYMLDTSAIGDIAAGKVNIKSLYTTPDQFHITHIQKDEIAQTGGYAKVLRRILDVVDATNNITTIAVWDVSRWDEAEFGNGEHYRKILESLPSDDGNEIKDAIIAETAIKKEYVLVTSDKDLLKVVNRDTPGSAICIKEFRANLGKQ